MSCFLEDWVWAFRIDLSKSRVDTISQAWKQG